MDIFFLRKIDFSSLFHIQLYIFRKLTLTNSNNLIWIGEDPKEDHKDDQRTGELTLWEKTEGHRSFLLEEKKTQGGTSLH